MGFLAFALLVPQASQVGGGTPAIRPLILVGERLPGVLQPGYQRLAALGLHGVEELL